MLSSPITRAKKLNFIAETQEGSPKGKKLFCWLSKYAIPFWEAKGEYNLKCYCSWTIWGLSELLGGDNTKIQSLKSLGFGALDEFMIRDVCHMRGTQQCQANAGRCSR